MAGCAICSTTRTDVIRVREGDTIAGKIRAFARLKFRLIPSGTFVVCPTCLGEMANAKPHLSLHIRREMEKEKERRRLEGDR